MAESDHPSEDADQPVDDEGDSSASQVDALGRDKRRKVVGGQYGATVRKQVTVYGIFVAVLAVLAIGFMTVVSGIDNRDMPLEDTAPWTQATADQSSPRDTDFPCNGPDNSIPAEEIGKAVGPNDSDELISSCAEENP